MRTLQNQIRWCSRIQRALLGAMGVVVVAFLIFGYRPNTSRQTELKAQIAGAETTLIAAKSETKILPDIANEVNTLRARLDRSKKSIPKQQELPQFIRDVTQLSQQAQLKVSYKPGVPVRGELVCELPIQFTLEGDFVSVYAFLRNAEEMPRLTRIRGLSMKTKSKNGHVNVQLAMNIYFAAE